MKEKVKFIPGKAYKKTVNFMYKGEPQPIEVTFTGEITDEGFQNVEGFRGQTMPCELFRSEFLTTFAGRKRLNELLIA